MAASSKFSFPSSFGARRGADSGVVLELDLARGVLEARPNNPLEAIQVVNATSLVRLREALEEAAGDDRVKGLIVHAVPAAIPRPPLTTRSAS